jgi:large subunit ribosomal protein L9
MKVILRDNVEHVGQLGETVTVKDGFARNYLIPQDLAYPAISRYAKVITAEVERKRHELEAAKQKAELLAKEMENVSITIEATVGEEDKMFGSVTAANISTKLHELGYTIDKRKIQLNDPIKALGIFHVPVKLHSEVSIEVKVWVVKEKLEDEAVPADTAAEESTEESAE